MASQSVAVLGPNEILAPKRGQDLVRLRAFASRLGWCDFSRLQAGLELALAVSLIQLVLWPLAESRARVPLCGALAALCIFSVWRTRKQFRADLTPQRSASISWTVTTGATLMLAVMVIAFGWAIGILRSDELLRLPIRPWSDWLGVKLPTVAIQQLLLQWFFLPSVLNIVAATDRQSKTRRVMAVLICGAVFALAHLPNMLLVLLTFVAGSVWCALYLTHRRIVPLVASHLLLAVLAANVGHVYIMNMSVGSRCVPLLPKTVRLANGQMFHAVPAAVAGHIDVCQRRGKKMSVHGWIVDVRHSVIPDKLLVCSNGLLREVSIVRARASRPGVVRLFNDPSIENCGFTVDLPIEWFAPESDLRFFGRSTGGIISELGYGKSYLSFRH